jgi:hypothetical protein
MVEQSAVTDAAPANQPHRSSGSVNVRLGAFPAGACNTLIYIVHELYINISMERAMKQPASPNNVAAISDNATTVARAPHVATGAVVAIAGSEIARAVYAMFEAFNRQFFGHALAAPLVLITNAASARTLGDYIARDVHGLESRIRIAPTSVKRGEAFTFDVLLHEMVHAWQHEVDGETEDGYRGHGPRFARKCNAIGALLGLPPVGVKGRDGLPDCAHWPLNVRPLGHYPAPYVAPSRKASRPELHDAEPAAAGAAENMEARFKSFARSLDTHALEQLAQLIGDELAARETKPELLRSRSAEDAAVPAVVTIHHNTERSHGM